MDSFQNLEFLQNLYRLKTLGYEFTDPIHLNQTKTGTSTILPNSLDPLVRMVNECQLCDLSKSRSQSMGGRGNANAKLFILDAFVSPAEDESNSYFIGRTGTMLKDMIEKVLSLNLDEVYFTHAVKCKPFGFQQPSMSESNSCSPYLHKQLEIVSAPIIVTLGSDAYRLLTHDESEFEKIRGHLIPFMDRTVIPIYHPLHLLRNPSLKSETMRDLLLIKEQLK